MSQVFKSKRRRRGQSTIEAVVAIMLLSLIFFALVQIAYLYIAQMVSDHAAFVTARSHIVGFDRDIVQRAMEVGAIGMAGHLTQPAALVGLPPRELGRVEPILIEDFIQNDSYTIYYEHWSRLRESLPVAEEERVETFRVRVRNYPVDMPMSGAYMGRKSVNFEGTAWMLNHSAYYLE